MSIEAVKAYVERMKTDEKFRREIILCSDVKKRIEIIKAAGFDFTVEEAKIGIRDDQYFKSLLILK